MANTDRSIEDVPLNPFHQLLTWRCGGGAFVDGYVLCIIGVVLGHISTTLALDHFWEGMIAASSLIGVFFGGFFGGWVSNRLGRKKTFFIGPVLFIAASIAHLWADVPLAIFALRFVIGFAVGIEYPVATSMLTEFMPRKYRGSRLGTLVLLWFVGAATAYMLGEMILRFVGPQAWPAVLASSAIFGLALLLVRLGTPESPRWLLSQGRSGEAETVIRQVYGHGFSLANLPEQPQGPVLSFVDLLHSGYGKRMLFIVSFWTCSIIPVFAVYSFAPKVLAALNLKGDIAAFGSALITVFFVFGCLITTWIINKVGRRSLLINSFLFSGLALLGLGLFNASSGVVILFLFAIYALFIGGAQVLALVYPNEIFPTELRTLAVGVGTSVSRIGAAVGTYLVPMSLDVLGISQTMYVAAAVSLVGLLMAWALAPETRSMNLQQAAALT